MYITYNNKYVIDSSKNYVIAYPNGFGGIVTYDGDYKIHTFTLDGSISFTYGTNMAMSVHIIGGGGSGGFGSYDFSPQAPLGGGGGGNGQIIDTSIYMSTGIYNIIVGSTDCSSYIDNLVYAKEGSPGGIPGSNIGGSGGTAGDGTAGEQITSRHTGGAGGNNVYESGGGRGAYPNNLLPGWGGYFDKATGHTTLPNSGLNGTGQGGGGGSGTDTFQMSGAQGGSGIVIIKYRYR